MGPPRSSKKRSKANRAHCRVKEISRWQSGRRAKAKECAVSAHPSAVTATTAPVRTQILEHLKTHRILLLVSSAFPRVSNRTAIARTIRTAIPIPTLTGVIKLGVGVGVGVAEGGGGAFFAASIACTYCKR